MTCHLVALCFDAIDPPGLARFWAGVLGRETADDGVTLLPSDDTGFRIRFLPTEVEGNEFCVIPPGNNFLAGCGSIGALSSDGSKEVGYFWSEALGWPLVWDQDQETAIQSPRGGTKIAWGGPPVPEKVAKNRLHFDLTPRVGGDQRAEVDRLVSLGATRVDAGPQVGRVALTDPDGNELCVLAPPTV